VLWDDAGTLQVRLGQAAQTAGYGPVADLDEAREREEQTRLLYVAATRARDHLIVSLHHKEGRECHARQLLPLCEVHADLIRRPDPPVGTTDPPRTVEAAPSPGSAPPADDRLARRRAWEQGRAALVERLGRQPVLAATTVAAGADGDPALRRIRPRGRRGDPRDGSAVGRAVHAVLETVDLGAEGGFEDLAAELATAEGVPAHAAEVAGLVAAALASDPVRQARRGRHWREVYVAAPVGDAVIEGFVDLLYETDDGLVVIDYKTDLVAEGSIDAAVDRYRLQVAAYAAALEVAVGRPVAAAGLLFLAEGSSQTRFVSDLAGAITEVAAKGVILDR
jgi:ATP-dependent helicase/nuclease subunit A